MPNAFAYVALFSWPAFVFVFCRMLPPAQALIASLVGGYLLLPFGVAVDLPFLPLLDKNAIPAIACTILFPLVGNRQVANRPKSGIGIGTEPRRREPRSAAASRPWGLWIEVILLLTLLLGPILTVLQNAEPYVAGRVFLRGLGLYDGLSMALAAVTTLLPYFLARHYLSGASEHLLLLKSLVVAGLLYSILALIEVRLSPQLSRWIYGFLAQTFSQAVRDGGYRPVVFLQHGLWLAIFFAMCVVAALAVWRQVRSGRWLLAGLWLLATLALSRSLGALAIAVACVPVLLLPPRSQIMMASAVAVTILLFPVMRGAGAVPVAEIAAMVESVNADRAESLTFRLRNEDTLLARANQKPLAGWGGWGRSRIFDSDTGQDTSTTDGQWIITLGTSGWLGYIGQFGLLTGPVLLLALQRRRADISIATAGLCLVLVANLVDLIPNASLTPLTWIATGALMGYLRRPGEVLEQPILEAESPARGQQLAMNPYSRRR